MRLFSRLETKKYLGVRTPASYVINLTGEAAFKSARAQRGALTGVGLIKGVSNDSGVIVLNPSVNYVATRNQLYNWSGDTGRLYSVPNALSSDTSDIAVGVKLDSTLIQPDEATVTSVWKLKANEGFAVRLLPYSDPTSSDTHIAFQFGKWRIIFYQKKVLLVRINSNWNITKEKTALDNDDGSLIGPRSYYPPTNTGAIYDVYQELDKPDQSNSIIGDYYELAVLPEPGAGVHVAIGDRGFANAEGQSFVGLLEGDNDVYAETPLTVYTRSNALFFQVGTMTFANGSLVVGPLATPYNSSDWSAGLGNISYNVRGNTPAGTGASVTHEIINDAYFQFRLNLATSDSAYTPFVYWAQAALQGGAYVGDTQFQIDTNDLLDSQNNSPIMDIQVNCDGDMRRRDFIIQLRSADKIQEKLFEYNGNPQSFMLENQLADLSMGAAHDALTPVIKGGMITACEANAAKNISHNPPPSQTNGFHPWTTMSIILSDAWAILDNDIITHELAGDGLFLGDYVKHLLIDGGFSISQINISDTAGRRLPQAELGELPCVMPSDEQSRGDYLRQLLDYYGHEWQLYYDNNGIWQMRTRPTNIKAAYTTHYKSETDRTVILSELDWVHDPSNFYNMFRVEGATVRGRRICQEYVIWESIRGIANTYRSNSYLGYAKPFGTVRDEGIRTEAEAQLVLRSLVTRYGVSCRFRSFNTRFTMDLFQWDRITCDGENYAVWRINDSSLANDRTGLQVIQV